MVAYLLLRHVSIIYRFYSPDKAFFIYQNCLNKAKKTTDSFAEYTTKRQQFLVIYIIMLNFVPCIDVSYMATFSRRPTVMSILYIVAMVVSYPS